MELQQANLPLEFGKLRCILQLCCEGLVHVKTTP